MADKFEILEAVTTLHNVAKLLETEFGGGSLSEDIRDIAHRLNLLAQPMRRQINDEEQVDMFLNALRLEIEGYNEQAHSKLPQ